MPSIRRSACAAVAALAFAQAGIAGEVRTDVNIVTGIDMSDSVSGSDVRAQIAGIAAALNSPDFIDAVGRGHRGRIGFAVYGWFQRVFPAIVAWRTIGSEADARAAAVELEAFDVRGFETAYWRGERFHAGRLTDLSGAIDHGRELLDAAPFEAGRGVLNLVGNGTDNVGEDVDAAHARMLDAGFTVNAVVTQRDPALFGYYRTRVAGGWGAFVLAADPELSFASIMQRKLTWDIAAAP